MADIEPTKEEIMAVYPEVAETIASIGFWPPSFGMLTVPASLACTCLRNSLIPPTRDCNLITLDNQFLRSAAA